MKAENGNSPDVLGPILAQTPLYVATKHNILRKLMRESLRDFRSRLEAAEKGGASAPKDPQLFAEVQPSQVQARIQKVLRTSKRIRGEFNLCIDNALYIAREALEEKQSAPGALSSKILAQAVEAVTPELLQQVVDLVSKTKKNQKEIQELCSTTFDLGGLLHALTSQAEVPDSLVDFPGPFFPCPRLAQLQDAFGELNYDRFEHIEQNVESEKVETERIAEAREILDTSEKREDEDEILSFLKAGVPNDAKNDFYAQYYHVILKPRLREAREAASLPWSSPEEKELYRVCLDNLGLVEGQVLTNCLRFLDSNELFIYEAQLQRLANHFFRHWERLNCRPGRGYLGVLPYPSLECFLVLAATVSIDFKACQRYFKIIFEEIFVRMFTFEEKNDQNLASLAQMFEKLFILHCNQLFLHFKSIGYPAVQVATGWMAGLFMGTFRTQEVLYLVDRLLGFESLRLLPLLALGVFREFQADLLETKNPEEASEVLYLWDKSAIRVLNAFLFA